MKNIDLNKLLPALDGALRQVLSVLLAVVAGMILLRLLGVPWNWLRLAGADNGQNLGILLAALAYVLRR